MMHLHHFFFIAKVQMFKFRLISFFFLNSEKYRLLVSCSNRVSVTLQAIK